MKDFLFKYKDYSIYLLVSILVVIWNVVTMEYSIPWCDEVMLADTPATMHIYGEWATTAFYTMGEGSKPFSVYLPLYTWVLYAWISVLGFSFIKVRLCELLTTVILGAALLNLGKQTGKKFSAWSVLLFSLGFWFTDIMLDSYRQARPDMLGALMCVVFAIYVVKSLKGAKRYIPHLILFSALSVAAGIQSAVYLVLGFIFAAIFMRPVKQLLRPVICCVIGFIIGMSVSFLYMACFGEGKAFIVSIMNASGSVMKVWGLVRSVIFPLMGKEVTPLVYPEGPNMTFAEKLMEIFGYTSAVVLFASNILLLVVNQVWKNWNKYRLQVIVFSFSIFVILGYNVAGRYQGYYMWTAILPMLFSLLMWMNVEKKWNVLLIAIAVIFISVSALSRYPLSGETPCDRINAFIAKQNFKKSDKIAAPFSTFYALKPTHPNTYFYQVYPQDLMGDVNYIILPKEGDDYNLERMRTYLNSVKSNPKYVVSEVSTMKDPDLILYGIFYKQ